MWSSSTFSQVLQERRWYVATPILSELEIDHWRCIQSVCTINCEDHLWLLIFIVVKFFQSIAIFSIMAPQEHRMHVFPGEWLSFLSLCCLPVAVVLLSALCSSRKGRHLNFMMYLFCWSIFRPFFCTSRKPLVSEWRKRAVGILLRRPIFVLYGAFFNTRWRLHARLIHTGATMMALTRKDVFWAHPEEKPSFVWIVWIFVIYQASRYRENQISLGTKFRRREGEYGDR